VRIGGGVKPVESIRIVFRLVSNTTPLGYKGACKDKRISLRDNAPLAARHAIVVNDDAQFTMLVSEERGR